MKVHRRQSFFPFLSKHKFSRRLSAILFLLHDSAKKGKFPPMMSELGENREVLSKNGTQRGESSGDRRLCRLMTQYDRFSPVLSRFLAKRFGFAATVSLERVERACLSALFSRETPCSRSARIPVETLGVSFFIAWDDRLVPLLLDRLQGGGDSPDDSPPKAPTPLDDKLTAELADRLALLLGSFWREEFRLGSARMTAGPEESEYGKKTCFFIFCWEIRLQERTFLFELTLPSELSAVISDAGMDETVRSPLRILAGRIPWTDETAENWRPGAILSTDIPADALFLAEWKGRPRFWVKPGEYQGQAAVEIVTAADSPQ